MFAEEDEEDDGKLDDEVRTFKLIVHTINTYQLVFQVVGAFLILTTNVQINMFSYGISTYYLVLNYALLLCLGTLCSMEYNQGICGVDEGQASVAGNRPS